MKKTLLLSVVASTMIMAGGDIAPVEPVVEAPVAEASGWDFSGQAVAFYETSDRDNDYNDYDGGLFSSDSSKGNLGLQLRATNSDVAYGIGAGVELTGLTEFLNIADQWAQKPTNGMNSGGWISQAYLTYGFGNTSLKIGRQTLPKALSPFAYSESWNVFQNTFDAALVVNTDITDTTLVYAFVTGSNISDHRGNMSRFEDINEDGIHLLTAQNKSFDGLTLTGSWYYAADMVAGDDVNALWADAKTNVAGVDVALQGGTMMFSASGTEDTTAFGAQVGYDFGMFDASVAYSSVNDGDVPIHNLGTGVRSPLYTQMVINEEAIKSDSDTFVIRAGMDALGGTFGAAYGMSDVYGLDYNELDVTYSTTIGSTTLYAAYVNMDGEEGIRRLGQDSDMVRIWGRYNF